MITPYQTQYFAWKLTRRLSSEDEDKLTGAIMDAQIDLNPHQVDAALFHRMQLSSAARQERYHLHYPVSKAPIDQQLCRWLLLSLDRLLVNHLNMPQELMTNMLGVRREGVTEAARKL